jgi:hypothetical protein
VFDTHPGSDSVKMADPAPVIWIRYTDISSL